uniref:Acyltransferase n=1 Tax=Syphacia muris TaxID=451379 RepID=A0A158R5X4_9BILA
MGTDLKRFDKTWHDVLLENFAVIHYVFFFIIAPPLSIFLAFFMLFSSYWSRESSVVSSFRHFVLLYGIWVYLTWDSPRYGLRRSRWYQSCSLWKYFAAYFPIDLVKTADLDTSRNYIIGIHPHGVMGIGAFTTLCTNATGFWEMFPGITPYLATLPGQFLFPFRREYISLTGAVSCEKDVLQSLLEGQKGKAVGIILGGAEESLECRPNSFNLILNKRKGFIKLAFETGSCLVPCFNFGENSTYDQMSNERGSFLRRLQHIILQTFGFGAPVIVGCGIFNCPFGILPFRTPIHTVVGEPIEVALTPEPTVEQIEELHVRYCSELKRLFNEHKGKYGIGADVELNLL